MKRVLVGVSLVEAVLVIAAIVVVRSAGFTAGLAVLTVAVVISAATATVVIRRAGRRPGARSRAGGD